MKITTSILSDALSALLAYFLQDNADYRSVNEAPLRSELYSSEQMNRHAEVIAKSHKTLKHNTSDKLLKRLNQNKKILLQVRNVLVDSIKEENTLTPSAEWLLDNFYLIEEQIVIAKQHLPKGYSEGLPNLPSGTAEGMPRVFDIVLEIIAHSDGRVDAKSLSSFIKAYQKHSVLTIGELWAIPIMLRLAVIENLRRISGKLILDIMNHKLSNYWTEKLMTVQEEEPENLILVIADMSRSKLVLDSSFVAGFTRKLQGKGPALALPLNWLEQQLSAMGTNSSDLVRQENQRQAADQVSVRNSIGTLRFIGATDWREFVETLSNVEHILRQDISGIYPEMDFATRDKYRHVIEWIAKSSKLSETEVAQKVLDLTKSSTEQHQLPERQKHVGYYLVDKGLTQAMKATGMRKTVRERIFRSTSRIPVLLYLSSISTLTLVPAYAMCNLVYTYGNSNWWLLAITAFLSLIGTSQLAVSLVNWLATIWVSPKLLPRMDFSTGIPVQYRTLVIIPTMLSDEQYIDELVEDLEIRFLANKEKNLHFGLLTDFTDADSATTTEDDALVQQAVSRIESLNEKYKQAEHDIFFLFHRPRTWNAREKKWMGYERKRGKLAALNSLLRGRGLKTFSVTSGNYSILSEVKYVITLDSDTQLPRDTAWKFIATMAHPLNHTVYSAKKRRIIDGYGILQPRVASSIPKGDTSLYLRMQGNVAGIDPYTNVSSDVYQDIFCEGSFIGKGIYDVDIFEQSVHEVFRENSILSHDLLEGCYARAGLLNDVLLYEENPSRYSADVKRHHRWIRGDWQISSWILPFIKNANGKYVKNKLSVLSRWKIFDNLRRSLVPQALLLMMLLGWLILPLPWFWTLAATIIVLLPVLSASLLQLIRKPIDITLSAHLYEVGSPLKNVLARFIFGMAVLPYEAFKNSDAIVRTLWRMIVSRKHLLEWSTAASVSTTSKNNGFWGMYFAMWTSPLLSIVTTALLWYINPMGLYVAAPILALWLLAPALSWHLSQPEVDKEIGFNETEKSFLHRSARKTWAYFEQFVTADDNWLPPDNFQEQPAAIIAHRTSPTNMGLALLANISAYDFGYISGGNMVERCNNTLQSMLNLERYQGHFYNWYDTTTLVPLLPKYVSTVDSGNLCGHLLILRQGLLALAEQPIFSARIYEGFISTIEVLQSMCLEEDDAIIEDILTLLNAGHKKPGSLSILKTQLNELEGLIAKLSICHPGSDATAYNWANRLLAQVSDFKNELVQLAPWLQILPAPIKFDFLRAIESIPSLLEIQNLPNLVNAYFDEYQSQNNPEREREWLATMRASVAQGSKVAAERLALIEKLAEHCEKLSDVEYSFLFDKSTSLLRIGYNVEEHTKDDSFYDLLASEARLGIFVAIAQGKLPQESWFALGRLLTNSGGDPILLSWSGSMFEYLMPQLVMPAYNNTLLYQTSKATVKRQIEYAQQRDIPWGISESAYNRVDANLNYQYRAFGVPGLGLKRGLEDDLVIAPYATMLALMVTPDKAYDNLQAMSAEGFEGEYGFFEAVDYTTSRVQRGKSYSIIKSYMVHHQGMSLLSLAYVLLDKPMQQRFTSELRFQATLLLLQERIPRATLFYAHTADLMETYVSHEDVQIRNITTSDTVIPEVHILSNGRYHVMVTNSGGGYSRWNDVALTRWREDTTKDDRGILCYIKDTNSGNFWSNTYHPTLQPPKNYHVVFSQGHAEFNRQDYGIDTRTEIVISPEDDTEMRRIKITNNTQAVRVLEITSYAEVVMASQASDEAHQAFSNLFVQTEIASAYNAIICTRRPRSEGETPPWMFHLMDVYGAFVEEISYETDRMKFIGRGRMLTHPQAMDNALSGTHGAVLDPITSIRYRIVLKPGQTATIDLVYGISDTRDTCESLIHKYTDKHLKNRAFELSWTHSQVLLRQINATEADAQLYDRLASSIIYPHSSLRAEAVVIQHNSRGQSGLWSHSISGDLPIVLVRIRNTESMELVKQMIQAHAYWRMKGLAVDLVIWNEDYSSYRQVLQEQIMGLISADTGSNFTNNAGHVFVKSADQLSSEDRILFESIARAIIYDDKGPLSEQVSRIYSEISLPPLLQKNTNEIIEIHSGVQLPENLLLFNGTGGFTPDGKEYKIMTGNDTTTPAPWVNIIANPQFGTVISESGSAYTWAANAHEYRITPWNNDPVCDTGGEAFYLRDEEQGYFWSPSSFPVKGNTPYITTHGFGYSTFEHIEHGIASEMTAFVDKDLPVKFIVIKLKNLSGRERKCSATGFLEIILGDVRAATNMHILSEWDTNNRVLLFSNKYRSPFSNRIAFFKTYEQNITFTTDRSEFIGRNRNLQNPQAMYRERLAGRTGAGMDTCAALQVKFDLAIGEEREIVFQVGSGENEHATNVLLQKLAQNNIAQQTLLDVKEYWQEVLGGVQITTPDKSLDIMSNGWLAYQTIACRIFARSGFYQSGGALGFRDQIQDVLALLHTRPQMAREQILLHASRQFVEGDVQHWWHPPDGKGVRTHCSDDLLWLPFAVYKYVAATGDNDILNVKAGFLESRLLHHGEDSLYVLPVSGNLNGTIYEHCVRAIERSLQFGAHGLPFIGSGDWNDGMDRVGSEGTGESVWLAFFLYDILVHFADIAVNYGDDAFADVCKKEALTLQTNIETSAWDGQWYMRAYFDDGTPLGSRENEECSIDAIAQSWAVLSGAANTTRRTMAMASLDKYLVDRDNKIIKLLDPPFDKSNLNPGYIKGYVPGVRENGGQYSHAAIWALMAFAVLGDREKVWELFSMIQPLTHSTDAKAVQVYKVEPYVMAADIYANELHEGRGGWTWYTGSSGWMYQFILGSLIGLDLRGNKLKFKPCFPLDWPCVTVAYRYKTSNYKIKIVQVNNDTESWWKTNNETGSGDTITLTDDGLEHHVEIHIRIT